MESQGLVGPFAQLARGLGRPIWKVIPGHAPLGKRKKNREMAASERDRELADPHLTESSGCQLCLWTGSSKLGQVSIPASVGAVFGDGRFIL